MPFGTTAAAVEWIRTLGFCCFFLSRFISFSTKKKGKGNRACRLEYETGTSHRFDEQSGYQQWVSDPILVGKTTNTVSTTFVVAMSENGCQQICLDEARRPWLRHWFAVAALVDARRWANGTYDGRWEEASGGDGWKRQEKTRTFEVAEVWSWSLRVLLEEVAVMGEIKDFFNKCHIIGSVHRVCRFGKQNQWTEPNHSGLPTGCNRIALFVVYCQSCLIFFLVITGGRGFWGRGNGEVGDRTDPTDYKHTSSSYPLELSKGVYQSCLINRHIKTEYAIEFKAWGPISMNIVITMAGEEFSFIGQMAWEDSYKEIDGRVNK